MNEYNVRLFLSILAEDFRLIELDMYGGEHKKPPFLLLNPIDQMPALKDDGFVVADSQGYRMGAKPANEIHQELWMARDK